MTEHPSFSRDWFARPSRYPIRALWLRRLDGLLQFVGVVAIILGHGLRRTGLPPWQFGAVVVTAMLFITLSVALRYRWSLARASFASRHRWTVLAGAVWALGMVLVTIFEPLVEASVAHRGLHGRWWAYVGWSELVLAVYSLSGIVRGLRSVAAGGVNPAFVLVMSFVVLISAGTLLLMLPACRATPVGAPLAHADWQTALFTATSASCVTGLVVEHTGTYWSRIGQTVILLLIQFGGLGIMTFGAVFAVIAGKNVRLTEYATLRELLAAEGVADVRRIVLAIFSFTMISELLGALFLLTLWDESPGGERVFFSVFHAVSAFCNAGFALTPDSLVGMAGRWQVWGVIPLLIIIGGLGFTVLYNVTGATANAVGRWARPHAFHDPRKRVRLRLTSKLVLVATALLISTAFLGVYLIERTGPLREQAINLEDAWFQAVTLRTAGFNTVDIGALQPATKLLCIGMMMIGASPGSTAGGFKTTVFMVALMGLLSALRGRERVEASGRTILPLQVSRALCILLVFVGIVLSATALLTIFEQRPELFLDHLFEAASAAGTVGLSSSVRSDGAGLISITQSLTPESRLVLVVVMFLGRIGPLTLLLALASDAPPARYEYPPERVTLG